MKSRHILTAIHGEQDSQAALIRIDTAAVKAIRSARKALDKMDSKYRCTASMNHLSDIYHIHFLSGIPAGFIPEFDDPEDMSAIYEHDAITLDDLDEQTFIKSAESAGFYQRSECTGLKIYPDSIYIVGMEKHGDQHLESQDISPEIPVPV